MISVYFFRQIATMVIFFPGLSSLDQMHLLAMADTVASCKIDLAERFAIDAARNAMDKVSTTSGFHIKRILPPVFSIFSISTTYLLSKK